MPVARIAVSAAAYAFDRPYSYRLTADMRPQPGCRVLAPFGRGNRPVEGVVLSIAEEPDSPKLKPILKVLDSEPLLSRELLRLALWMRGRFFCTVYDAVKAVLPAGVWFHISTVYRFAPGFDLADALSACGDSQLQRRAVETVHAHGGAAELTDLQGAFGDDDPAPALRALVKAGVLSVEGAEKRRVQDKETVYAVLSVPNDEAAALAQSLRRKAPQQAAVLDLLGMIGRAPVRELCEFTGASAQSVQALIKKDLVHKEAEPAFRRPTEAPEEIVSIPDLTAAQRPA